jgi:3-methyladenine DNA glycosylase AlkD
MTRIEANSARSSPQHVRQQVRAAVAALDAMSTKRDRENLARFGITATKTFGVSMANIQVLAKRLGHSHELAAALWKTGWYEARLLTSFVDEPDRVTPVQMDRWCRDFDNWGICDTLCFHLFDRTPHAWSKVQAWHDHRALFVKRAAFALLASLALHDKRAGDERFVESLGLVERAAGDDRHFVKKGVSWALRLIGRRNRVLNEEAVAVARRLSDSGNAAARWVGRGAVKELTSAMVMRRIAGQSPAKSRAATRLSDKRLTASPPRTARVG